MKITNRPSAFAAALSLLTILSACGGGGDSSPAPVPPPPPPPPANRAPTLTTTAITTNEDVNSTTQVAATDPDGNPLTFSLATNPQHGTATLTAAGALTYAPVANYFGADSLGVTVSDNAGAQVTGTINITVTAVNDAPVMTGASLSVNEDGVLNAGLAGSDIENDAFTFQVAMSPGHGNLAITAAGAVTYTPATNYSGTDQFRVRLVETASGIVSSDGVVNVTVSPVNDAPLIQDDALRVPATPGQAVTIPVLGNDSDVDGDTLTPTVLSQPRGGTVTVNATTRELTFTPTQGYVGPIDFTYRVSDGNVNSGVATVRAVIGDFESAIFLSDYSTPGIPEVHVFDGLRVRRVTDDLAAGSRVSTYSVSGDLRTFAYVVDSSDAERVYVKPLDGSAAAALRYTSPPKTVSSERRVSIFLNADGSYLTVHDRWTGTAKYIFVVNAATGAATQVAGLMPGILDVRFAIFHPFEPRTLMVQAQTGGTPPHNYTNAAVTAFLADAADPRTLTQIGRTYSPGEYGSGEGFYYGRDPRYIFHGEHRRVNNNYVTNLLVYDRTTTAETPLVRFAWPPDRGVNGVGWLSPDMSRMCISFYQPTTTTIDGPSRFYAVNMLSAPSVLAVSPIHNDTTQCTFASDNRTMIYRAYSAGRVTQLAYAVDSVTPGTPSLLAPSNEVGSEQGNWQAAPNSMRIAILYYDNDGSPSNQGQAGRFYSLPLDGSGQPFLFSDSYVYDGLSPFYASNGDGSFIAYGRPQGGISALELMSTHAFNHSIRLSSPGEMVGVREVRWLRRYP